MVQIENRKIKRTTVLGHRQVEAIRVHVPPAQSQCFGLAESGEEQDPVVGCVDRVLEFVDDPEPLRKIIDDPPVRVFRVSIGVQT